MITSPPILLLPSHSPGRLRNDTEESVRDAIEHTRAALVEHSPFDAIGGICDGALIAAMVAATDPALQLFINMCGAPWEDLPTKMQDKGPISIPSIHFLGQNDEMFTIPSLMSLPNNCHEPVLLMHPQGHVVPMLSTSMTLKVVELVEIAIRRKGAVRRNSDDHQIKLHMGETCLVGQPQGWESKPGDVIDSLTLILQGKHAKKSVQTITSAHIKFFASVMIIIAHFSGDNPRVNTTLQHIYGLHLSNGGASVEFGKVIGIAPFSLLLGHAHQQHLLTPTRFIEHMFPLATLLWLSVYSGLPHAFLAACRHAQITDSHGIPHEKNAQLLLKKLLNPMWFIYMAVAYLTVAFALNVPLHMLTLARHVMPRLHRHYTRLSPAVCALLAIAAAIWLDGAQPFESPCAVGTPPKELCPAGPQTSKHFTLINRVPFQWVYQAFPEDGSLACLMGWDRGRKCEAFSGSFSVRYIFVAYGGNIIREWWLYAVAPLLLPTEFPARLPGEGRSDGRRSTVVRLLWVGGMIFVYVHSSELFNEQSRGMVQIFFNFSCRFVAVVGFLAAFPRSPNALTELCYFSAVLYPVHEYLLVVLELPVAHGIGRFCWPMI